MIFVTVDQTLNYHTEIIREFGGCDGVRDLSLLISAIEMPKSTMFGEFLHVSIFDKAAAYLFHIISNHPFIDGNKRTGVAVTLSFLDANSIIIDFDESQFEDYIVSIARGEKSKDEISSYLHSLKL